MSPFYTRFLLQRLVWFLFLQVLTYRPCWLRFWSEFNFFKHVDEAKRCNLHVYQKKTIKSAICVTGLSVILQPCWLRFWTEFNFFRHVDEARRGNLHVHRKRTIKSAIFDTGLSVILLCLRNNDNCFLQKWPFLKKWNKLHKSREGCLENMTKGTFRNIKNRRLSFKWFRREKKRSCLGSVQRTLHSVRLC